VFTPIEWAIFFIEKYNLLEKWLGGATIFDPTMGEGNLLEAFLVLAQQKGYALKKLPIDRLFGVEINTNYFTIFLEKIQLKYHLKVPENNFVNADIFDISPQKKFDIIFSNPPWQNFNDLPMAYKLKIKELFFEYELVSHAKNLLLGDSRIDIAALVIQKVIAKHTKPNGEGIFFIPLSLLLNEGANNAFRNYQVQKTIYQIDTIFDFNKTMIFDHISTRYGVIHLQRDKATTFPIDYKILENATWQSYKAKPLFTPNNPLSIYPPNEEYLLDNLPTIELHPTSCPRQGINTCGANHIFFFDSFQHIDDNYCEVGNAQIGTHLLPSRYVYPLVNAKNFTNHSPQVPCKWVLLPYEPSTSKILSPESIAQDAYLFRFFQQFKTVLSQRKGILINISIKKGYWWALLGVGKYNFFRYKIIWESYGKTTFTPQLFEGRWQANQSLQAYIPVQKTAEAKKILHQLQDKRIETYLLSLRMKGTMNWAQPGKIKKLVKFV
jgi:hypothetical protein